LEVIPIAAQSGSIGGSVSHEFALVASTGEDKVGICEKCGFAANIEAIGDNKLCPKCGAELMFKSCIESGHIFKLGTKYSEPMNANFTREDGTQQPLIMGCYGIGVGRLLAAIVEANNDEKGIIWPVAVAPYDVHVLSLKGGEDAEKIASALSESGLEVLFDDREDTSAGEKFADSEIIGIPVQVIVSERGAKDGIVEIRKRANLAEAQKVKRDNDKILDAVLNLLSLGSNENNN
jgi:prolyl-tRNA synthetase